MRLLGYQISQALVHVKEGAEVLCVFSLPLISLPIKPVITHTALSDGSENWLTIAPGEWCSCNLL